MVRKVFQNLLDLWKHNKKAVFIFLIGTVAVDILLVKKTSDVVTFGVLLAYGVSARRHQLTSKITFLLCLGLLVTMFLSYVGSGASIPTEKAAVWLVLFMALGIYQQWKE